MTDSFISILLARRHNDLLRMRSLWKTTFVSDLLYWQSHIRHANLLTSTILGEAPPQQISWLHPMTAPINTEEDEEDWESDGGLDDGDITGELVAEALGDDEDYEGDWKQLPLVNMSWEVPVSHLLFDGSLLADS
jgi:hypothetical protein